MKHDPTTSALTRALLIGSMALALAGSCRDERRQLTAPNNTPAAHVPTFSSVMSQSGATFTTDKDDYKPGDTLRLSGAGWPANDSIDILLDRDPQTSDGNAWVIGVDLTGAFRDSSYQVQDGDLGVTFTITATSRLSGETVQATFTDGTITFPSFTFFRNGATTGSPPSGCSGTQVQGSITVPNGTQACALASFIITGNGGTAASIRWRNPSGNIAAIDFRNPNFPNGTTGSQTFSAQFTPNVIGTWTALLCESNSTSLTGAGATGCANQGQERGSATFPVSAANTAPNLVNPGNKDIAEEATLSFTLSASDPDAGQTIAFSIVSGTQSGMTLNTSSGAFSWTPTEAQGPGTYSVTFRATDNGATPLSDDETITITVHEVNQPPILATIGNRTVAEGTPLGFTASASDVDVPSNALSFSLVGAPAGASISPTTGIFSWTPGEAQGPGSYTFTIRVTDNGLAPLFDEETITVTVDEVNSAPVLSNVPAALTTDELVPVSFDANASDIDLPPQSLVFSLIGAPGGAAIDPASGVFSWTPSENAGPGVYPFTVRVSDGTDHADANITITVHEVNEAPVISGVPTSLTTDELVPVGFDADASDADVPAQALSFALIGAPAGAAIDPSTGVFVWTPSEAQGPGTYLFTVRVSDGITSDEAGITITVHEVNVAPSISGVPATSETDELVPIGFDANASDADIPAQTVVFSLIGAPAGASIDPGTGVFTWTPSEIQGPGAYPFTVRASDGVDYADASITITVHEVNVAPVISDVPGAVTVDELDPVSFDASASDVDLPAQTLTFSLIGAPSGATIDGSTGAFSWTPSEAQGPGAYSFRVRVSDGIDDDDAHIMVTVNEVNLAPSLDAIGDRVVNEQTALNFTASASDPDDPPNTLTFSLSGAPTGAAINASSGAFSWTPTEAQGPGAYTFTVRVSDDGQPSLSDEETIRVSVNEVNRAPSVDPIPNQTVAEETPLTFTATATDPDAPANELTFSLSGAVPVGASITSDGHFTWTPIEAQGPHVYHFNLVVTDDGSPNLSSETPVQVTVNEVNVTPVLDAIGAKAVDEESPLSFTATASDADRPANVLTFSLSGAPAGASINSSSGAFVWMPTEAQGPGSYTFTVRVTDNGTPPLSDEEAVTVSVREINRYPTLNPIGNKAVHWGDLLTFTAVASDPDIPANTLTFTLDAGAPAGASINATSGAFIWTPSAAQLGSYAITVRVTDNGVPARAAFEAITVTVGRRPTTLVYSGDNSGQYSDPLHVAALLSDQASGTPIAGKVIHFTLTPLPVVTALTASGGGAGGEAVAGLAMTSMILNLAPGSYTIASRFDGDAAYESSFDTDPASVTRENALATYTGLEFVSTSSITSSTANVTLRATIQDVTAVFPAIDAYPGVITNALVTFVDRDGMATGTPGTAIPGCSNLAVTLIGSDPKVGSASCTWSANIGSADSKQFTIGVVVNNYYTRDASADNEVITVSRPLTGFITGGGYLINQTSAGTYAGTAGLRSNFGFNVKNNKSGTNVQGNVNIIVRGNGRVYQIKSNAINSLTATLANGTTPGTAQFSGKANVSDITNPLTPISLGGNYALSMTLTDMGEPGNNDTIGFTVWNGATLLFASNWSGAKTLEQQLNGGNLQVR